MAKKEKKEEKSEEKVYTIPLGKVYETKPAYKRSNKAVTAVKSFVSRHSKASEVKVGQKLNQAVWAKGGKKPPRRIQVKVTKDDKGVATVEPLK